MNPSISQAILLAVAVIAVLFLIHRFAPASKVAKLEDAVIADAKRAEPALRGIVSQVETAAADEASQLLTDVELWLTDDSAANAKLAQAASLTAEAVADKANRRATLQRHIAALQAKMPAA